MGDPCVYVAVGPLRGYLRKILFHMHAESLAVYESLLHITYAL